MSVKDKAQSQGKNALIRGKMMGIRGDFCARSVLIDDFSLNSDFPKFGEIEGKIALLAKDLHSDGKKLSKAQQQVLCAISDLITPKIVTEHILARPERKDAKKHIFLLATEEDMHTAKLYGCRSCLATDEWDACSKFLKSGKLTVDRMYMEIFVSDWNDEDRESGVPLTIAYIAQKFVERQFDSELGFIYKPATVE